MRRVEELARQGDHLDDVLAGFAFAGLVRGHGAVGEDEAGDAGGREVVDDVLDPGEVGVAGGRHAVFPALVVAQPLSAPIAHVERRVGEDIVGFEVGEAVVVEGVAVGALTIDAADGEVHLRKPPGGVVGFLAVDGNVSFGFATIAVPASMCADELHRLHKHAGRAAAGVVHAATVGLEHLDKELHHAARGVELAALLALGAGELREKVFVHTTEHVLGAAFLIADFDVANEVDQLAEALLVQRGAGVVLGQHALEGRVVAFDGGYGVVHALADRWLLRLGLQVRPARLGRDPEDVLGAVSVGVFGVGALVALGLEPGVLFLESVGDVLEEDEAEDDVLVFGGVHRAAQGVGHPPKLCFVAQRRRA